MESWPDMLFHNRSQTNIICANYQNISLVIIEKIEKEEKFFAVMLYNVILTSYVVNRIESNPKASDIQRVIFFVTHHQVHQV